MAELIELARSLDDGRSLQRKMKRINLTTGAKTEVASVWCPRGILRTGAATNLFGGYQHRRRPDFLATP